jgi:hypothetical protein
VNRAWEVMPGVPAYGHMTPHGWHPNRADGCQKCPDPEPPPVDPRRVHSGDTVTYTGLHRQPVTGRVQSGTVRTVTVETPGGLVTVDWARVTGHQPARGITGHTPAL